jgi:hypothetical protein
MSAVFLFVRRCIGRDSEKSVDLFRVLVKST